MRWPLPLALLALACGGPGPESEPGERGAPSQGGTAIVALAADFDAFNEFVATSAQTEIVIGHVLFQNLLRYDEEFAYEPMLADSFAVAEDGLSATFRLRQGVRWHDGEPVTVDDVIWSFETSMIEEVAYPDRQSLQYVEGAERVDDRTVRFRFTQVHAEPLADFIYWTPMPKHLLENVPPADMPAADFNRAPVGNGPFRFVSWQPNEQVVLEANEDFWGGRPHLDRIVFRIVPEPTTQLVELLGGGIDVMRHVPASDVARLEASENARPFIFPTLGFEFMSYNLDNPLFADVRVRRALTMAIDRQALLDGLLQGHGTVTPGPAVASQWESDPDLDPWPYDPDEARRLLAEAGWTDADGDGRIEKDGRPLRFEIMSNAGNDLRRDMGIAIQQQLAGVGIEAVPRLVEFNTMIDRWMGGDFDAFVAGWDLYLRFDPSQLFQTGAPYNGGGYSNPRVDELLARALTTLDRAEAEPLWDEFLAILHADQPYTFLMDRKELWGTSRRLQGVAVRGAPNAYAPLASAAEWWIPEGQR